MEVLRKLSSEQVALVSEQVVEQPCEQTRVDTVLNFQTKIHLYQVHVPLFTMPVNHVHHNTHCFMLVLFIISFMLCCLDFNTLLKQF